MNNFLEKMSQRIYFRNESNLFLQFPNFNALSLKIRGKICRTRNFVTGIAFKSLNKVLNKLIINLWLL